MRSQISNLNFNINPRSILLLENLCQWELTFGLSKFCFVYSLCESSSQVRLESIWLFISPTRPTRRLAALLVYPAKFTVLPLCGLLSHSCGTRISRLCSPSAISSSIIVFQWTSLQHSNSPTRPSALKYFSSRPKGCHRASDRKACRINSAQCWENRCRGTLHLFNLSLKLLLRHSPASIGSALLEPAYHTSSRFTRM